MNIKFHSVKLSITSIIAVLLVVVSCNKDKSDEIPNIETVSITAVNCHSALSGGKIKSESGLSILQKGVCYGKTSMPDTSNSRTIDGEGTTSYSSFMSGLNIETKYYVRAYIITSFGLEYGNELSFTTSSCESFVYGGRTYQVVQIGNQCWMAENLSIGTTLHGNQDQLNNGTIEQYVYNNQLSNLPLYGGLYQWNEQMEYSLSSNANPSGVQGIAPTGWHIPSDAEWQELELFLGMSLTEVNFTSWRGSIGNLLKPGGKSAFEANFGGRTIGGIFSDIDYYGYYWTSTVTKQNDAWHRIIDHNSALIKRGVDGIHHGMSVRCVKD